MILGISGLLLNKSGEPIASAGSGKDAVADILTKSCKWQKISFADPLKRYVREIYNFSEEQLWGPSYKRNEPDLRYPRPHSWDVVKTQTQSYGCGTWCCTCCGQTFSFVYPEVPSEKFIVEKGITQCYLTPRYSLQQIGTAFGRDCYPNTWVNIAVKDAKQVLDPNNGSIYNQKYGVVYSGRDTPKGIAIPDVRYINELDGLREHGTKIIRVKRTRTEDGISSGAAMHSSERECLNLPDSHFDYIIDNDGTLDELTSNVLIAVQTLTSS